MLDNIYYVLCIIIIIVLVVVVVVVVVKSCSYNIYITINMDTTIT